MRILNRPMFRYGGPIKEGIMHGMKNGGLSKQFNTGLVGDERYPQTGGREHHGFFLPALYAAGRMALRPFGRYVASQIGKKGVTSPGAGLIRSGLGKTRTMRPGETYLNTLTQSQNTFQPNWLGQQFIKDPLAKTVIGGTTGLGRGIKWTGQKIGSTGKYAFGTPSGLLFMGAPVTYMAGKYFLSDGTELNQNQIKQIKQVGPPGGGETSLGSGEAYYEKPPVKKSAAELAAEAKAARTKKLNKYLDTMGYDKAKKTAIGDALIDASAIVQGATDEAGSLKDADWGRMINQAIQTTSKRLDKPEQIREAVGLMMTKADIEKDLKAGTDAQDKLYKSLAIQKLQKELEGNTFRENLVAVSKTMQGQDAVNTAVQLTEGKNFRGNIINTTDFNKILKEAKKKTGVDDITVIEDYTQKVIDANPDKFEDGHYTVGNNVVTVKDKTVIAVE